MQNQLEELGYTIQNDHSVRIESSIRHTFPGFDVVKLLQIVEQAFTHTSSTPVQRTIKFDNDKHTLLIDYRNIFTSEDDALLFIRRFENSNNEIYIHHDYCVIPKPHRGKGYIKQVFQESLTQYINMKAKKILVHAGLSGGGYVWAKHGFKAVNQGEVSVILEVARKQLSGAAFADVESIYKTYYSRNPGGRHFPILLWAAMACMKPVLLGSNWHGELDLTNPTELTNFKNYVFLR